MSEKNNSYLTLSNCLQMRNQLMEIPVEITDFHLDKTDNTTVNVLDP